MLRDGSVVEPIERFLAHLTAIERSPNTVKAYAHDLRDYFEFLEYLGLQWDRVVLADLGRFVTWLRLPGEARDGRVAMLPWVDPNLDTSKDLHGPLPPRRGENQCVVGPGELGFSWCWESEVKTELGSRSAPRIVCFEHV